MLMFASKLLLLLLSLFRLSLSVNHAAPALVAAPAFAHAHAAPLLAAPAVHGHGW